LGCLVGLCHHRSTGLLQDLSARQGGSFLRVVGIHDPAARGGAFLDGQTIIVSGRPEFLPRRVKDFLRAEAKRRFTLADHVADTAGIDLADAARAKLVKNAEKYPVDKAYGSRAKYSELG